MYFNKLGTTDYRGTTIPDILKRVVVSDPNVLNTDLFEKYDITEGETPESLSFNYYGKVDYYWVIMLLNNIKSRYFDWPMSSQELGQYIESKYGNKSSLFVSDNQLISNPVPFCNAKYVLKGTTEYQVLGCDRDLNKLEVTKLSDPASEDPTIEIDDILTVLDKDKNYLFGLFPEKIVYENAYSLHHFNFSDERNNRVLLQSYISGVIPPETITNQEYENNLNEAKRSITLIKQEYVSFFVNNFKTIAQG
jgi:hypothetical protein